MTEHFSICKKYDIFCIYIHSNKHAMLAHAEYLNKIPERRQSFNKTYQCRCKFKKVRCIYKRDLKFGIDQQNADEQRDVFTKNVNTSIRQNLEAGISKSSASRILRKHHIIPLKHNELRKLRKK